MPDLSIAIFSDVICPWCYVGKRRLERALGEAGTAVEEIEWLPFELNPTMPEGGMERSAYRAQKFGADRAAELDRQMAEIGRQEGITFAFDRMTRTPNTRRAHMLIAHASRSGRGDAAVSALFRAYFEEARDIGDPAVVAEIGADLGLDPGETREVLENEMIRRGVERLEAEAGRLGIGGVPFFILNRAWSVSGAQPTEAWVEVLRDIDAKRQAGP